MGISLEAVNELEDAIDRKIRQAAAKQTRAYGEVSRIESDGTVYVLLDGAESDTPASGNAAAVKEGERVSVTVDGGQMVIDGNYSAPATDDTAAKRAQSTADAAVQFADTAASAAASAQASADDAAAAAADAQGSADAAANSLKSVVQGATTVEKAVSVMQTALEAVVDYDPQNDTVQEWFWHDANGAHVLGDTSGYRNDITSSGMDIKQVSTEDSVASFGAGGWQVGLDDESHMVGDYHSMRLVDVNDNTYFYVSDLRDADGWATIVEHHTIGDANAWTDANHEYVYVRSAFILGMDGLSAVVEGWDAWEVSINQNDRYIAIINPKLEPWIGQSVVLTYKTRDTNTKAFTLGRRDSDTTVGPYSYALGRGVEASALCSFAEGALSAAKGRYSHAQNFGTIASSNSQTAIGKYNVEDAKDKYAAILGNGTSDSARSNALTVDWSGNVGIAGDVQDMSGNQLYADASHEHSAADITSGALARANGGTGIDNIGYYNTTNNGSDYTAAAAGTWYQACSFTIPAGCGILFARLALSTGSTAGYSYVYLTPSTLDAVKADPPDYNTTSLGLRIIHGTGTSEHKDVIIAVPYNIAANTTYYLHWKSISTSTVYRTGTIRYLKLGKSY